MILLSVKAVLGVEKAVLVPLRLSSLKGPQWELLWYLLGY